MPWTPCAPDGHNWLPIDEWAARYRCQQCDVIGYRGFVTGVFGRSNPKNAKIIQYKCPKCHGPTTKFHRKRLGEYRGRDGSQLCPTCIAESGSRIVPPRVAT